MSWFGWGSGDNSGDASGKPSSSLDPPTSPMDMSGGAGQSQDMNFGYAGFDQSPPPMDLSHDTSPTSYLNTPVLALDAIKQSGVPVTRQMTPYLQMDPSLFAASTPQYIMPDGGTTGKGKFEFALGHIGWAVSSYGF
ncbi:hypothetical protein WR25_12880 [Diploscapter pachys]|uniref:Uncharacterized protein n=1 Tax=Diploscapter pachys TaxID=2018661 RepID=A0A2A2M344_9BILA|nr:hypothetical protein WR25_12880 [Diploscapter pachys]